MGGLFVMSPSRRHSSRLPAFFMPQKRQIHLLRLETGPDTLLGLTQAAPALREHPVELKIRYVSLKFTD